MKKIIYTLAFAIGSLCLTQVSFASGTKAEAQGVAQSQSGSGASANTGAITFNSQAAETYKHTSVDTTPNMYVAPSMFGGQNNCGMSDSIVGGVTGFGIGISHARESMECNTREDTAIIARFGLKKATALRFFCFGADVNRKVYEASGHKCPSDATAKGLEGAPTVPPVFQKVAVVSGQVSPQNVSPNNAALRKAHDYWGNDPIIMKRYGITQ